MKKVLKYERSFRLFVSKRESFTVYSAIDKCHLYYLAYCTLFTLKFIVSRIVSISHYIYE